MPGISLLEMSASSTGEVQEALQRVTAELDEANRELHDLREVKPLALGHSLSNRQYLVLLNTNILCMHLNQHCRCQCLISRLPCATCYQLLSMLDTV